MNAFLFEVWLGWKLMFTDVKQRIKIRKFKKNMKKKGIEIYK